MGHRMRNGLRQQAGILGAQREESGTEGSAALETALPW
jgi:hypothetical protein